VELELDAAVELELDVVVELELDAAVELELDAAVELELDAAVELELEAVVELELDVVVELELDVVLDEEGAPPVLLLDVVAGDPLLLGPVVAWLEDPPFPFDPPPPQAIGPEATPTTAATIPRPFTPSLIISPIPPRACVAS
jgi:hypothetical protein